MISLSEKITGKIIYRGEVLLTSPLCIGSGEKSDDADITVLRDSADRPYIPATSIIGALRHFFDKYSPLNAKEESEYFWGSKKSCEENQYQSAFTMCDLVLSEASSSTVRVRDGIEIDNKTGIIKTEKNKPGKKYVYEIVESGSRFDFSAEVTLRECFDRTVFKKIMAYLLQNLHEGRINLGAKTTRGFGRCHLEKCEFQELIFTEKKDVLSWLSREYTMKPYPLQQFTATPWVKDFTIDAVFSVKNSLLVRSYSAMPNEPDAVHIFSHGKPVLPGTSLAGALKARAEKIINTLHPEKREGIIHSLFGWVDDRNESSKKYKSRVYVEEMPIKAMMPEQQTRIKIDRFTGGTIKGALLEEEALWPEHGGAEMVRVKIRVSDFKPYEAGLLLLVLKDLWTGDIPLGGEKSIGRGVLQGIAAKIGFDGKEISMSQDAGNKLSIGQGRELLEQHVSSFVNELSCKEVAASE
ncbi:MAG: hypothetical protein DDT32_00639 [Syntrophomonadaceae bacterium]|nr:hypothetical protein [Bacillota bacterium]